MTHALRVLEANLSLGKELWEERVRGRHDRLERTDEVRSMSRGHLLRRRALELAAILVHEALSRHSQGFLDLRALLGAKYLSRRQLEELIEPLYKGAEAAPVVGDAHAALRVARRESVREEVAHKGQVKDHKGEC